MYIFDRTAAVGRLELVDQDRLKLLHNMTTQDFNTIKVGEGRPAVLTTALARIIDQVMVYHRGETALMLTHYPQKVRQWLQRHIFFNDKVRLRDVSAELGQLEVYGEGADAALAAIIPGADSVTLHQFLDVDGVLAARAYPLAGSGYLLIAPVAQTAALKAQLLAREGAIEGSSTDYEHLRIDAGLAGADHELTEEYIPLEAGLWDSVSFNKGCYIGQEIIARMESRGKLAKTLVKLNADMPVSVGAEITAEIDGEGRQIGRITSASAGLMAALGFVKTEFAEPGTSLRIGDAAAQVVDAPLLRAGYAR